MAQHQSLRAYQPEETADGKIFGEFDKEKLYPFPKGWLGRVVVRQVDIFTSPGGAIMEDPATSRVMNYETEVYNDLLRKGLFGEKTKVTILHDPT